MSADRNERMVQLRVHPRLGVSFRILDASMRELGRGVDETELPVAPGIYMVEWQTMGTVAESLVRVEAEGPDVVEVRYRPAAGETSDDQPPELPEASSAVPRSDLVALVGTALRPSERGYESSVAIVVAGEANISPRDALVDARLFDRDEVRMRANKGDAPALELDNGEYARCYRVRPGRYHLRFRSATGETLAQSVPALGGRQTIVFLRARRAQLLVASGETFVRSEGVGIDASSSVCISVDGEETGGRIRERIRLAGVLLHDLAAGTGSLSREFIRVLGEPETDPLLRLYAAVVAQSCLDLGRSPAIDETSPDAGADRDDFVRGWADRMTAWVAEPGQPGMPVDATTLRWRVRQSFQDLAGSVRDDDVPSRIEVPPMLECSWRWAISESVDRPNAVPSTPSLLAATRSAGGTTPWLCWKASAAKAAKGAEPRTARLELDGLIRAVASKTDALIHRDVKPANLELVGDPLLELGPDGAAAALRSAQLAGREATSSGYAVRGRTGSDLQKALALALSLPAVQLRRRLARTSDALDALLQRNRPLPGSIRQPSYAPGLLRRVEFADDPQRGRFGVERQRRGFTLSAEFEETSSRNWSRIVLQVSGNAPDGTDVEFHLHDSFKPPLKVASFKKGTARTAVTAWGGFTVGIWIPSLQVELELNLATVRAAPRIIRTR